MCRPRHTVSKLGKYLRGGEKFPAFVVDHYPVVFGGRLVMPLCTRIQIGGV